MRQAGQAAARRPALACSEYVASAVRLATGVGVGDEPMRYLDARASKLVGDSLQRRDYPLNARGGQESYRILAWHGESEGRRS